MDADDLYSLGDIDRYADNHYNWIQQYIQLDCMTGDLDLRQGGAPMTKKGSKAAEYLVHEYIHYLQNFATCWGADICADIAGAYLKIGASAATDGDKYDFPLTMVQVKDETLLSGLTMLEHVKERLARGDGRKLIPGGSLRPFDVSLEDGVVVLCNGILQAHVGLKVIRESMAHMGTSLYLGRTDAQLHTYNELVFKGAGSSSSFAINEEYWIVFEYFYGLGRYSDVSTGVFSLMQQALCTADPEKVIYRFFKFAAIFDMPCSLLDLVEKFGQGIGELTIRQMAFPVTLGKCRRASDVCRKHEGNNHLCQFAGDIIDYTHDCIIRSQGGKIFNPYQDFRSFDYWREKIFLYGTGFVRFYDGCLINGSAAHCEKMETPFTYLLAVGLVVEKLTRNNKLECPYLSDFDICRASHRDPLGGCYHNPFLVTNPVPGGDECAFRNAYLLLHMDKRIRF